MTISANSGTEWLTSTPSKSGYELFGIVGYAVGTNTGILMNQCYIKNNTIYYSLYNTLAKEQNTVPRLYVLWALK